jgi:hypothetical protein
MIVLTDLFVTGRSKIRFFINFCKRNKKMTFLKTTALALVLSAGLFIGSSHAAFRDEGDAPLTKSMVTAQIETIIKQSLATKQKATAVMAFLVAHDLSATPAQVQIVKKTINTDSVSSILKGFGIDLDTLPEEASDIPFITVTEEGGTPTLVSLLRAGHPDAQIDAERLDQKNNAFVMLPPELMNLILEKTSVREGVSLRETCYAFYHVLSDTRFDRAFNFGKLLHHTDPLQRSPEFRNGALNLPLALRQEDRPSIFREDTRALNLSGYTHALPEGLLTGATNLESLQLRNHTSPLPKGVFDGAKHLAYLSLDNHTHALPEGLLARATNLRVLALNGYTHALPEGLLAGAPNLEELALNGYTHALPEGLLAGAPNLEKLALNGHTSPLPKGVFDGLTNLTRLGLNNYPHALPEGLLDGLTNLEQLYLNNYPHALPEGLLDGLTNLEQLYLNYHQHPLPEGLLTGVQSLQIFEIRGHTGVILQGFEDNLRARVYNGLSIRA